MTAPFFIESSSRFSGATVSIEPSRSLSGLGTVSTGDPAMDRAVAVMETRKKVVAGSFIGGAGLILAGLLIGKPAVKWPAAGIGLAAGIYGLWLKRNIDTTMVLPWERDVMIGG